MRRIIVNIAIIIIAFSLQSSIFRFLPFLSVSPNFMIIFVFSYGFIYGQKEGMLYGVIVGLLMDLFYSGVFGFFTLIFVWLGFLNGSLSKYFYEDYIMLPLALCAANEVVYNFFIFFFRFFIRGKRDLGFYLQSIVIPEIIMTLLFTLLIYRVLLGYNRKLEEIDIKRGQKNV
ncbi:MAG: rod shape-determining protein MreD [Johnsonella sp.]|nr:rod shape-determining protein MreD [Johnsonella sp.]